MKYFNNMHSYSQLVLLSWGYTSTPPDNYMQFVSIPSIPSITTATLILDCPP